MTMTKTRQQLALLLATPSSRVIALSGKWGTGKTRMLTDLLGKSSDSTVKNALQISLFGVRSLEDLKLKLLDRYAATLTGEKQLLKQLRTGVGQALGVIASHLRLGNAANQIAVLALPMLIKEKMVIIDDIERKHESLSIDEVLGFIDELVNLSQCRVLVILNSDKLKDASLWHQFREKVIDDELSLETTPQEAFDLACEQQQIGRAIISRSVGACGITNIRIIKKVLRVLNGLAGSYPDMPTDVMLRIFPSIVLLTAIYYQGIENGPSIKWVLQYDGGISHELRKLNQSKRGLPSDEEGTRSVEAWVKLLGDVGVRYTDEFELIVADFLRSGMLDDDKVKKILASYISHERSARAESDCFAFMEWCTWNPELPDTEVIAAAVSMVDHAKVISGLNVTSMVETIEDFDNSGPVIEKWLDGWIAQRRAHIQQHQADRYNFELDAMMGRKLHPKLIDAIIEMETIAHEPRSLVDVLSNDVRAHNWNSSHIYVVSSATFDEVYRVLSTEIGADLRSFVSMSIELYKARDSSAHFVGDYPQVFMNACRHLFKTMPTSRRARLIQQCLKSEKCEVDLTEAVEEGAG